MTFAANGRPRCLQSARIFGHSLSDAKTNVERECLLTNRTFGALQGPCTRSSKPLAGEGSKSLYVSGDPGVRCFPLVGTGHQHLLIGPAHSSVSAIQRSSA